MTGDSNDETNFPYKLLLTDTKVWRLRKVFVNGLSTHMKFSKTQLPTLIQSGGVIHDIPIFGSTLSNLATKRTDLRKYFLHKQVDKFNKKYNRWRIKNNYNKQWNKRFYDNNKTLRK